MGTLSLICVSLFLLSCGTNFYSFLVYQKDTSEILVLEEARNDLDEQEYGQAVRRLEDLDEDSNERSLLLASAHIGASGLDLWSLIRNVIEDDSIEPGGGVDAVFESVSNGLFGEGEERVNKRTGMRNAINALNSAPDQADVRVDNLRCFLGGLWSYPTIIEASSFISNIQSTLTSIDQSMNQSGDCGSTDDLSTSVGDISTIAEDIQLINNAINGCSLFSTSSSQQGSLNSLEQSLSRFSTNADVGCAQSACTGNAVICAALEQSCVQQTFTTSAAAGDGTIETCEILYGCSGDNICF